MTTLRIEIPDKPEELPATELVREGRRVLDGILRGRVYAVTGWGEVVAYLVPVTTPEQTARSRDA